MDKLHLHEKFTKENFLNLCSLRWSEWGRWRRFFVISGAIAAIVVSAPSFVMILPCVTVFYLISCTVKNAVEIVSNWKWGPIFPKKRIKKDEILTEIEESETIGERGKLNNNKKIDQSSDDDEVESSEDYFLDSLESINGDESEEEVSEAGELENIEEEELEFPESNSSESEEIFDEEDDDSFDEDLLLDVDALEETEKSSKNFKRKELR